KLLQKIMGLNVKPEEGNLTSSYVEKVNKKWFVLNENPMKISRLRFIFSGDEAIFEYENETGMHQLDFGIGKQKSSVFPEKSYFGKQIGVASGKGYDCLVSGAWGAAHKMNLLVYVTALYIWTVKMWLC